MNQITYRGVRRYKYQLTEPYEVDTDLSVGERKETEGGWLVLEADGRLKIQKRYAWDGPSGPTIDTHTFMRGSLVHDALYQLMRDGQVDPERWRKHADELLRKHCREDGMNRFRAWYVYRSVRLRGKKSAKRRPKAVIKVAPRR